MMDVKKKTLKLGLMFLALFFAGGLLLVFKGHDAVSKRHGDGTGESDDVG